MYFFRSFFLFFFFSFSFFPLFSFLFLSFPFLFSVLYHEKAGPRPAGPPEVQNTRPVPFVPLRESGTVHARAHIHTKKHTNEHFHTLKTQSISSQSWSVHPKKVDSASVETFNFLKDVSTKPNVVAVGEIGQHLDHDRTRNYNKKRRKKVPCCTANTLYRVKREMKYVCLCVLALSLALALALALALSLSLA